ncbi:aminodeoxychorismate synthase component I [Halobacillus kuroshimensis]|uniref:Aminodeoxychorismate synthase component I n=1 Tax=Halobacillus kuroshimensis TaxID=302481 RepID=A0ABS3DY17_9BACI|nr:aminodeoxychorismate synthase component I [Halobacillus kuroshimensis]MBN8236208.1 aminodeoxychorismate synthase component I [Halobacillus kuroshimensis]
MNETPFLHFEFVNEYGEKENSRFEKPVEILTTDDHREVKGIFDRLEHVLDEGYYAAGFVSYEAAPAFDEAFAVHDSPEWPLVWFGIFEQAIDAPEPSSDLPFHVSQWKMKGSYEHYQKGIEQVKKGIEEGDTYQVNYTTRLEAAFSGDAYSLYKRLIKNQKPDYGAYINIGGQSLLSASPELFFRMDNDTITAKPMKGTAARGRFHREDEEQYRHLQVSEKEKSENLMIVDLLRNDLGRLAVPGSVRVPALFEIETYPTVHQMTSTVTGELPASFTMYQVFEALFPCGSITGAPKVRTMEYIQKLEDSPRDVYCGAIGFITPRREAVFNVPIRTIMINHDSGRAVYGTGGGVTWDSTSEGEYQEVFTKARLLTENRPDFHLLETMKLEEGHLHLMDYHLERLERSARYFRFSLNKSRLKTRLLDEAAQRPEGLYKVRLLTGEKGREEVQVTPMDPPASLVQTALADTPVSDQNPFLFHKTTHREVYERHKTPGKAAVLLWNERGELTEFTIANLVVKYQGEYLTPPVTSGLLGGTYRQYLLDESRIKEQILYKDQLGEFDEIWMVNALRGWVKVEFS